MIGFLKSFFVKEDPKLYEERPRYRCPFYGFFHGPGVFLDQSGNQCPLTGGYTPCLLERNGNTPNWDLCHIYNKKDFDIVKVYDMQIFPKEFDPPDKSSWGGIKFRC